MGATAAGVRRILGAERDVDAAEINTRAYGGLSKDAARELRDRWAAPLAESLGISTGKLLTSYTDALKLGIPNEGAKAFSELATKTSEAWGVPFEGVTDILGTVNSILTSKGDAFNFNKLKSTANTIQYLAAKQSTTSEKLMSFLQRGAGAADVLGMSQEAGLAFGSASTSLGNQPGQSGRMFDYLASRLIEMPRLTRRKGDEGDQARELVRSLGYGSAEAMERQRRADPDAFLPDFLERFNRIGDPKKQDQAIRFFTGREWLGEFGRMVKGIETYKEAQKLQKEANGLDAIGDVWNLHRLKLGFVFRQFGAGWLNILGEFGKELSPLARPAGDFFLEWTGKLRAGGIRDRFKAMLDGLLEGLGVKDFPDLLRRIFGDPATADGGAIEKWRAAARGFGEGIRSVVDTITGFAKVFTGGNTDPERLGKLTAQILGFGFALMVVSPFVGVLGNIATGLMGIVLAAGAVWKVMRALGIVGGAATGGAAGAAGAGAGILGKLSKFLRLGGAAAAPLTIDPSKEDNDRMMGRLGEWARKRRLDREGRGEAPVAAPDPLRDALRSLDPDLAKRLFPDGATVELQSLDGGKDWRDLIRPAVVEGDTAALHSLMPQDRDWFAAGRVIGDGFLSRIQKAVALPERDGLNDRASDAVERLQRQMARLGDRVQPSPGLASATASALGAGTSGEGAGGIGTPGDPAKQFGSRFFTPPGMKVPGWYGRGSGGEGGGVTPPMLKGEAAANAKTAYDFFRGKGLSHEAASGILASMKQESGFNPRARGDGGRAHGLFQHHPDRRAAIERATGVNMSTAGVREQLEGAWWEMNHGDAGARRALGILRRPGISAREAGGAFVQHFERPARDERASRGAMAEGFAREFGDGGSGSGLTTDGPVKANLMHGQYGGIGENLAKLRSASGFSTSVNKAALPSFQGFLNDLETMGYKVRDLGGFNPRRIRGGSAWSQHAYGNAIDLNPGKNPLGTSITDMPEATRALARKYGLIWGMDWKGRKDPMHFEWNGTRPWFAQQEAVAKAIPSRDAVRAADPYGDVSASLVERAKGSATGSGSAGIGAAGAATAGERMIGNIPAPAPRPGGGQAGAAGAGASGNWTVNNTIHVNGANRNPQEIAGDVQRYVSEAWQNRAHDLEAEIA